LEFFGVDTFRGLVKSETLQNVEPSRGSDAGAPGLTQHSLTLGSKAASVEYRARVSGHSRNEVPGAERRLSNVRMLEKPGRPTLWQVRAWQVRLLFAGGIPAGQIWPRCNGET